VDLPDGAKIVQGGGGLARLTLQAREGVAHVYLHGAHLTHFQPAGERPVLWLSAHSAFAEGLPIRGGVPICFPWFGPKADEPAAPMHGFARLREWTLVSVEEAAGELSATLALAPDAETRRFFPHAFSLSVVYTVGRTLRMALTVGNEGASGFRFEEALHSYFAVGDVRRTRVEGLEGAAYVDKADAWTRKTLGAAPLVVTAETDRVFTGHAGPVTIEDAVWARRIDVERTGSATAVVWNPWVDKAKAMKDFGDGEWTGMICVESANAMENAVSVDPGSVHRLTTAIAVRPA
jgi:glucose-6-phosphate 1-epimerase